MKKQYTVYIESEDGISNALLGDIDSMKGGARQKYIRELLTLGYLAKQSGFGELRGRLVHIPDHEFRGSTSSISLSQVPSAKSTPPQPLATEGTNEMDKLREAVAPVKNPAKCNALLANMRALSGRK